MSDILVKHCPRRGCHYIVCLLPSIIPIAEMEKPTTEAEKEAEYQAIVYSAEYDRMVEETEEDIVYATESKKSTEAELQELRSTIDRANSQIMHLMEKLDICRSNIVRLSEEVILEHTKADELEAAIKEITDIKNNEVERKYQRLLLVHQFRIEKESIHHEKKLKKRREKYALKVEAMRLGGAYIEKEEDNDEGEDDAEEGKGEGAGGGGPGDATA